MFTVFNCSSLLFKEVPVKKTTSGRFETSGGFAGAVFQAGELQERSFACTDQGGVAGQSLMLDK